MPDSELTALLAKELEPAELIDESMAQRHLALLGINPGDPVILCAYGQTNRYCPERQGDRYEWPGEACGRDWGQLRRWLQTIATTNLGFISCPGGTRVKDRLGPAEIFECSLLVYEVDSIPKADQLGLWEKAGLPEPTVVMDTGSKSLHCWYRLAEPVSPEQGREARQRLSLAIDAVLPDGKTTDGSMHSCHQPARLAGGIHPKTGERSTLVRESGQIFALADLMALCPELPESTATDRTDSIWRAEPEDSDGGVDMPELPLAKPVPLTIALGAKSLQDIEQGVAEGGRRVRAWSLSQTLQCAEQQLQALNQPFTGSAFEMWQGFVERCGLDLESTVDGYWVEGDDIGEGDLSRTGLLCRLRQFAIDECGWDPNDWIKNPKQGGFLWRARQLTLKLLAKPKQTEEEKAAASEAKAVTAIDERMQNLYELERSGNCSKQAWAHKQYHRSVLGGYRVRCEEVDRRLIEMVAAEWDLQIQSENNVAKRGRSMSAGTQEHDQLVPQIPGFTLLGRDALLVGSGGVGKTLAALGLSYQTAVGNPNVFDRDDEIKPEALGATLWIGTDGGDGAYSMLNKYISILKAPQERTWRSKFNFWGSNRATGETPWAFNVSNLHKLFEELEQGFNGDPYRLVVIDSLKAVMDLGGIDFGIGPMGTCMRLIQAAADRFNVTVLWLHHTKPGAAKTDMGIDGAGGNSNITQVPFAVHTLHKVQRKGHDHVVRWTVQKLRGEPSRSFEYTLDPENGFFKLVHGDVEEDRTTDILFQLWLKRSDGVSTTELVDCIDNAKKTIQNRLTALGKDKLIRSEKRRWHITSKGTEPLLLAMPELTSEVEVWKKGGG